MSALAKSVAALRRCEHTTQGVVMGAHAEDLDAVLNVIESIPPDRLHAWHTVTVKAGGWQMAHPLACDLAVCPFDGLAQAEWVDPPTAVGVWRWHDFEDEPWDWTEEVS